MASTLADLLSGQSATKRAVDASLYFDQTTSFATMGLDRRLFKAVAKTGFVYPSLVQSNTIPLILEGRDVLVRARTGTGKTAAYVLPILHNILSKLGSSSSESSGVSSGVQAIVLVPTRDLCDQVRTTIRSFLHYAKDDVRCVALNGASTSPLTFEASMLKLSPQLLVATPGRLLQHLLAGTLSVRDSLRTLIVDEADLVLSYGYEDDVKALNGHFPQFFQCILMSATLTPELDALKGLLLHNPAVVKLDEAGTSASIGGGGSGKGTLSEYFLLAPKQDKLLLLYVHAALGVFKGKTLFFVNTVAEAFHLKLFLEQFKIRAVVLNDDLPYNSRRNIVLQFNRGVFDFLIATDLCSDEVDVAEEARVEEAAKIAVMAEAGAGQKGLDLTGVTAAGAGAEELSSDDEDDDEDEDEDGSDDDEEDSVKVKVESKSDDDDDDDEDDDDEDEDDEDSEGVKEEPDSSDDGDDSDDSDIEVSGPATKRARAADVKKEKKEKKEEKKEKKKGKSSSDDLALLASAPLPTPSAPASFPSQRSGESEDAFLSRLEASEASRRSRVAVGAGSTGNRVGATRGIDFIDVQTVVNVDFPLTYKAYTHRVGRTARAGKVGQAISYVCPAEQPLLEAVMEAQSVSETADGIVVTREPSLKPLPFALESANSFRYRVAECMRRVTANSIKEARLAAIRSEMLNSARLQAHFEDNPHEAALLRHASNLSKKGKVKKFLNYVPSYLIPAEFRAAGVEAGRVELSAHGGGLSSRAGRRTRIRVGHKRAAELDPLRSFTYADQKKKDDKKKKEKKAQEKEKKKRRGRHDNKPGSGASKKKKGNKK